MRAAFREFSINLYAARGIYVPQRAKESGRIAKSNSATDRSVEIITGKEKGAAQPGQRGRRRGDDVGHVARKTKRDGRRRPVLRFHGKARDLCQLFQNVKAVGREKRCALGGGQ